jgi:putative transposase
VVANALRFHHGTKLHCGDFVVMPNHVHWIVAPMAANSLEDILHSVKRWSAREVNRLSGRQGSLWQKESFDRIIRDTQELGRTRDYIQNNGIKACLGESEYLYWRADWL